LVAGSKYDVFIASPNCLSSQQSAGTSTGMAITGPYIMAERAQLNVANPTLYPGVHGQILHHGRTTVLARRLGIAEQLRLSLES